MSERDKTGQKLPGASNPFDVCSRLPSVPNLREPDFDDPDDEPIEIKGEPLSETIIRERR